MYDPYAPEQAYVREPPANEAMLVAAALDSVTETNVFLQATVRPPMVPLVPVAETVRGSFLDRVPRVQDMFSADDRWGNSRCDYSQRLSGYSSSSYPSLNQY